MFDTSRSPVSDHNQVLEQRARRWEFHSPVPFPRAPGFLLDLHVGVGAELPHPPTSDGSFQACVLDTVPLTRGLALSKPEAVLRPPAVTACSLSPEGLQGREPEVQKDRRWRLEEG